jgi:type I restriction enzyme S subunit
VDSGRRVTYGIVQPGPRQERGGVPIIRGQDYSGGQVDDSDLYRVSDEIAAKYRRSSLQGGDILLSIVGYLGLTAMVPDHLTGANLTQTTARIAIDDFNDRRFFHYQFQGPAFEMEVRRYTKGSAQPGLNLADVDRMRVVVPPHPEQKKIAAILSSVDEAIQATQAVIEQTRRVKEGLLQDLLTKGIGHTRFKQTEIGEIPETWEAITLGQVAEIRSGIAKNTNRVLTDPCEVAYLRVANVQDGYLDLTEIKTIRMERTEISRYALRAGDVLMNEGGDIDKLGRGDVWAGQIEPCVHQNHVFAVRGGPRLRPRYLSYLAESPHGKAYFLAKGKQTTNLASINKTQLQAFPVPLPSVDEQDGIVERLDSVRAVAEEAKSEVGRLGTVKAGLLQDLLTGKVRVSV